MSSGLTIVLVLMGLLVVMAVVFGIWLVLAFIKLIFRGIGYVVNGSEPPRMLTSPTFLCPRGGCRAVNPSSARFCRRCGRELLRGELTRGAGVW